MNPVLSRRAFLGLLAGVAASSITGCGQQERVYRGTLSNGLQVELYEPLVDGGPLISRTYDRLSIFDKGELVEQFIDGNRDGVIGDDDGDKYIAVNGDGGRVQYWRYVDSEYRATQPGPIPARNVLTDAYGNSHSNEKTDPIVNQALNDATTRYKELVSKIHAEIKPEVKDAF